MKFESLLQILFLMVSFLKSNSTKLMKLSTKIPFITSLVASALCSKDVIAVADTSLPQAVQIFGTVKVTSELKSPSFNANSAVYATIRQDLGTWTSAVRNIKAPPILSKRIPLSALETESIDRLFPLSIAIDSSQDSTPEGISLQRDWTSGEKQIKCFS